MQRKRLCAVGLAILCVPLAHANGAMGLGLEMFDPWFWFAYVLATVLVEAWLIGRYLKVSPWTSLGCSLLANLITGICGGPTGCISVFLHFPFVGSGLDPKPLLNAIALLTAFAIPSAAVEMIVWDRVAAKKGSWKNLGWIVLVHLITIPLALAILLIPDRPYRGLEGQVRGARHRLLRTSVSSLEDYVAEHGSLPNETSATAVVRQLIP